MNQSADYAELRGFLAAFEWGITNGATAARFHSAASQAVMIRLNLRLLSIFDDLSQHTYNCCQSPTLANVIRDRASRWLFADLLDTSPYVIPSTSCFSLGRQSWTVAFANEFMTRLKCASQFAEAYRVRFQTNFATNANGTTTGFVLASLSFFCIRASPTRFPHWPELVLRRVCGAPSIFGNGRWPLYTKRFRGTARLQQGGIAETFVFEILSLT